MKGPTMAKTTRKTIIKKAVAKRTTKTTVPEVDPVLDNPMPEASTMGRYWEQTIQHGQNLMFAENGPGGMELTDKQLTVLWNVNWPKRKGYRPDQIPGARRDYNLGKHGTSSRTESLPKIGKWKVDTKTNERTYHQPS
tara:strand:+ start:183 stop:596 length:414 start_codon:yes stop_codon:yes gene_type:complete